jgi:hypothetical protein
MAIRPSLGPAATAACIQASCTILAAIGMNVRAAGYSSPGATATPSTQFMPSRNAMAETFTSGPRHTLYGCPCRRMEREQRAVYALDE